MSRCTRCCACESMYSTENCQFCNYPDEDSREGEPTGLQRRDYLAGMEARPEVYEDEINRECKRLILEICEIVSKNETPLDAMRRIRKTEIDKIKNIILRENGYDD